MLAGWVSPTGQDGSRGGQEARPWDTGVPLSQQAVLAGWATPQSHDQRGARTPEKISAARAKGGGVVNLHEQVGLASGTPTTSSPAEMGKRGVLNPAFSLWLQGFPSGWLMAAPVKAPRARRS